MGLGSPTYNNHVASLQALVAQQAAQIEAIQQSLASRTQPGPAATLDKRKKTRVRETLRSKIVKAMMTEVDQFNDNGIMKKRWSCDLCGEITTAQHKNGWTNTFKHLKKCVGVRTNLEVS